jgi:hypothetical protein
MCWKSGTGCGLSVHMASPCFVQPVAYDAPRYACLIEAHPEVTAHATRRENTMPFTSRANDRASSRFEMRLTAAERQ